MKKNPFVSLVFRGSRFQEGAMPLEALPELVAYRDLVVAVAKGLFQQRNPQRQKLPKGFEAHFRLVLEKVDHGSVVPQVSRLIENTPLPIIGVDLDDLFDTSRDLIQSTVQALVNGHELPTGMTAGMLARFTAFGRTLRDDESVVVSAPLRTDGPEYTRKIRSEIIKRADASYEDDVSLVGEVRAADKDKDGFDLRTSDGRKIAVHAPPLFFPMALASMRDDALVRVQGTGLFDATGVLQKITMATDVSLAEEGEDSANRAGCPTAITSQIDALGALPDRWFNDDEGKAYPLGEREWLSKLMTGLLDAFKLPTPYLYPTPEGPARAEWSTKKWEIVLNVDVEQKTADAIAVDPVSGLMHELPTLSLGHPGAESRLGQFVRQRLELQD